jgi:hypothetical protein
MMWTSGDLKKMFRFHQSICRIIWQEYPHRCSGGSTKGLIKNKKRIPKFAIVVA